MYKNSNKFRNSIDLASNIYRNKNLLKDAENEQTKRRKPKKKLSAAEKLLNNRQEVIDTFKTGICPYIDGFQIKEESEEELVQELEEKELEKIKDDSKKFIEYTEKKSKGINYDLFKDYFNFLVPSALEKKLYETKNKNKNNELVEEIKNR